MTYLLDTCVLSEYVKKKPNQLVIDWLDTQNEADLFISILSLGKLKKGMFKLETAQPGKFSRLNRWISTLETRFDARILSLDRAVMDWWAKRCGESEASGKNLPLMDSLIAATAATHSLTVVTRNVKDYSFAGVPLFNPWGP